MSTGGGAGYNPEDVRNQDKSDKSLLHKLKDAIKPHKHSSAGPTAGHPSSANPPTEGSTATGGESAAHDMRPQEGLRSGGGVEARRAPVEQSMPGATGMRHQGEDTPSGIMGAMMPGGTDEGSSATTKAMGDATRQMTSKMSDNTPDVSKGLKPGIPGGPGSAGTGAA
ncbi:hypothetical protein JX265_012212 [Neoarthrinium moseri]|uniref:Uncharacterized protein n=1 Tax=Neoarthrinium moseri TaxID=1658444 RepID=A0A9Q0AIX1_9PEZI|nr:uncharacterized protein JN550_006947 [Neoarthrinium moseri]KAI1843215.1 hypothetical protein JX266_010569 [Neoarthrinium moseri]KAI1855767.1 hypothetical protein JX265_012212 [Neoarthrinium moseri]KAI1867806.1 hypothetical protein JN550_006947 [Neoarthrinium moseri]